jgi:hypothetical protein
MKCQKQTVPRQGICRLGAIFQEETRMRQVTSNSSMDNATFEETVEAAELFQIQTVAIIPNRSSRSRM